FRHGTGYPRRELRVSRPPRVRVRALGAIRIACETKCAPAARGAALGSDPVRAGDPENRHVRLFVGLEPAAELRRGLAGWARRELRDAALAPVPERNLHLTLCFLGWVPEARVGAAAEIVRGLEP